MDRFTLIFADRGLETGFVRSCNQRLIIAIRYIFTSGIVLSLLGAYMTRSVDDSIPYPYLMYLVNAFSCFVITLISLPPVTRSVGVLAFEWSVALLMIVSVWMISLANPWYAARLRGYDPLVALEENYHSDTGTLLAIDTFLTVVHMTLPVRAHILLPFQINGILCFVIPAFVLGSPEIVNAPYHAAMLMVLVALAAVGKRSIEFQERENFRMILREKELRFWSEHQLSMALDRQDEQRGNRNAGPNAESIGSQGAQTQADSGYVFGLGIDPAMDDETFRRISDIGRREQWLINAEELQLKQEALLGEGGFGVVLRGLYHGADVAVKVPKQNSAQTPNRTILIELCNELRILRRLRHPNICFLYGAVLSSHTGVKLCLVLELLDGISLGAFMAARQCRDDLRVRILCQVASALRYLHSRKPSPIVHGDLKDGNIFMQRRRDGWHAKLLDFGLSRLVVRGSRPQGGTLRWMAPELQSGDRSPSVATDVFSFGRVMFFVSTGTLPFADKRKEDLRRYLLRSPMLRWPKVDKRHLAWHCRPLAEECLQRRVDMRPRMHDVFNDLTMISRSLQEDEEENGNEARVESQVDKLRVATPTPDQMKAFEPFQLMEAISQQGPHRTDVLDPVPEGETQAEAAVLNTKSLDSTTSSEGRQKAGSRAPPQWPLVHQSFAPTPNDCMMQALGLILMHWNHPVPPASCCWMHASLQVLDAIRKEFAELPCEGDPVPVGGQCESCLLMCLDDCSQGARCLLCRDLVVSGTFRGNSGSGDQNAKKGLAARLEEERAVPASSAAR